MVQVGFPGGPRLEWYDRNPKRVVDKWFSYSIGPHALTVRWSYTVPTGKNAFIERLISKIYRAEAATSGALVYAHINITPFGEAPATMVWAHTRTNLVGDMDRGAVGHCGVLSAGDEIKASTSDVSTGGSLDYLLACKITEFDA